MTPAERGTSRADDDPRVGDTIKLRNTRRHQRNAAREIIGVDVIGRRVITTGLSGEQRNSTMSLARLAAYDRVGRRDA